MSTVDAVRGVTELEVFPTMGVTGRIVLVGAPEGADEAARRRLEQLESRWSRFRSDSDISRINSARGSWTAVSRDTLVLLRFMQEAHLATDGAYNPTVLPDTLRLGDDRSRTDGAPSHTSRGARRHSDLRAIEIDASIGGVRVPPDMTIDAGGIGKGLAADLVADEMLEVGASGACINIGGDLRCAGLPPTDHGWRVDIRAADDFERIESTVWVDNGAVATSTPAARTWVGQDGEHHHIIDPSTGEPVDRGHDRIELASVIADRCAWAEVFTKAVLVLGWPLGSALAERRSLAALAVDGDGRRHTSPAWKGFER